MINNDSFTEGKKSKIGTLNARRIYKRDTSNSVALGELKIKKDHAIIE